jgi:hypothetical protein
MQFPETCPLKYTKLIFSGIVLASYSNPIGIVQGLGILSPTPPCSPMIEDCYRFEKDRGRALLPPICEIDLSLWP